MQKMERWGCFSAEILPELTLADSKLLVVKSMLATLTGKIYNGMSENPLRRRARAFLELFLRTWMLSLTSSQLVWECREIQASESFPEEVPNLMYEKLCGPRDDKFRSPL